METHAKDVDLEAHTGAGFFREITEDRRAEALARGYRHRWFFPHRVYFLPKCGPDGFKLAQRMCGATRPEDCWEIALFADTAVIAEFPRELFFDRDILWHQEHLGRPGLVATADLWVSGDELYTMVHLSDLVQRISRRRELKTRIENRFRGWHLMLLNAIGQFALERKLARIHSPTAAWARRHTDRKRTVQPELFERIYDRDLTRVLTARRDDRWWVVDVRENEGRFIRGEKKPEPAGTEKTICLCHDIERGLGHRTVEPGFARQADQASPAHLREMLAREKEREIRATYHVVGAILNEVRADIESDGHALAFHSYDHLVDRPAGTPRRWERFRSLFRAHPKPAEPDRYHYQLGKCREIDYRIKGYRPPRSVLTGELTDANLCFHNFEWLASSAYSLGFKAPALKGRLVRIPILFDDFAMHRDGLSFQAWEQKALKQIRENHFAAFGLHDCYAGHWLPHYREFLGRLRELGALVTLEEVSSREFLRNAW